ncbi:HAD-like domain-containing protein, partial [Geopyxis carbonaria]
VCSIDFVRETLFPYALEVLPSYLQENWSDSSFEKYRDAFPEEVRGTPQSLEAYVRELSAKDLKVPCLKQLQGLLWRSGYESGAIKAPIYDDVLPAIKKWLDGGKKVMIYSSGSVEAQKLLFKHTNSTEDADMTPLFSGYYDTVNAGMKQDPKSYSIIAENEGIEPQGWLFLSDNVKEVEAAKSAGMDSIVLVRPGNAPLTAQDRATHRVVDSFEQIAT